MASGPCEALARNPWLLPFALALARGAAARPSELARSLGVRAATAKAALWRMRKLRLIEGGALRPELAECLRGVRAAGRTFVWERGSSYILVVVKRRRVAAYPLPLGVVERVRSAAPAASVKELSEELGLPATLVSRALRVLRVLGQT